LNIAWFSEVDNTDIPFAGVKGASLGEMYGARLPVPSGFIVTTKAYERFLERGNIGDNIYEALSSVDVEKTSRLQEVSRRIQDMILRAEIPKEIANEIKEAYDCLNIDKDVLSKASKEALDIIRVGRNAPFVAVRSSATAEDLSDASFAGQQATFLNVRGVQEVIRAVQKCWASLFTAKVIYYRVQHKFPHEKVSIAVIIQKMVLSAKSGVIFSVNPISNKEDEILVEAGFGLGEAVVSGSITPDQYVLSKRTKALIEKKVNRQEFEYRLDTNLGYTVKRNLQEGRATMQKLQDYELRSLVELAIKIEEHYRKPQDIEFAIEGAQVYIIQSSPITTLKKASGQKLPVEKKEEETMQQDGQINNGDSKKPETLPEPDEKYSQYGDVQTITEIKTIVDLPEYAENAARTGADGVGLLRLEMLLARGGIHPAHYIAHDRDEDYVELLYKGLEKIAQSFKGKPVWVRMSDLRTDEYRGLEGGDGEPPEANPMLGWHGIRRLLSQQEILKAEFLAIKRLHDAGYTQVGVMLPFVISVEEVKRAKEILEEVGLEPCENVEFGIMVETPASVQIIRDICEEGIDFVSFGTNDLTQLTLGVDRNNSLLHFQYNEMHPAILRQIQHVIQVCKEYNVETSICGQAANNPDMAEFLVKAGIDSIAANPDSVIKIRHIVSRVEKKLLLHAARKDFKV